MDDDELCMIIENIKPYIKELEKEITKQKSMIDPLDDLMALVDDCGDDMKKPELSQFNEFVKGTLKNVIDDSLMKKMEHMDYKDIYHFENEIQVYRQYYIMHTRIDTGNETFLLKHDEITRRILDMIRWYYDNYDKIKMVLLEKLEKKCNALNKKRKPNERYFITHRFDISKSIDLC